MSTKGHPRRTVRTPQEIAAGRQAAAQIDDEDNLTPEEAVVFMAWLGLPVSARTLKAWRYKRPSDPPFLKQGRIIRYRARDLRHVAMASAQ